MRFQHPYRIILLLHYVEGLSTREAAEVLEINPEAVKTRLHRACMTLRELLEREFAGEMAS